MSLCVWCRGNYVGECACPLLAEFVVRTLIYMYPAAVKHGTDRVKSRVF